MATPPKRGGNAPLFGARIAEGAAGDSDGPRAPCSALDPPQTLPLSRSAWPVRKVGRLAGSRYGSRSARQATLGRHDPETDFGMIPLPTPHHHQTGSATRSSGCLAIAQKGPAKAFCCAGDMMTADGGVGEAPVVSGLHTQKCPVQGIASNRTIIHPAEVIGRMGRGENPRQGVFPWFWPIGNTLR